MEEPESVYGRSKLEGDRALRERCENHVIARSSWLYGRHGRNFVDVMLEKGRAGESLTIVTDQVGSPTWTRTLSEALLELAALDFRGTVNVAGGGSVSWFGLARRALNRAGLEAVAIRPQTTSELGRPAPRPPHSALDCTLFGSLTGRALPHWQTSLDAYLAETLGAVV